MSMSPLASTTMASYQPSSSLLGDDQIADADLLPIPRQVGRRPAWGFDPDAPEDPLRRAGWMGVSVRGGGDQLVVEVAANERHERSAGRMNPANRQPSGNLGDLWVIAGQHLQLQLGCGFHGQAGMLLSEPCPLRLAAAVDAEQNQRRRATRG